MKKRFTMRMLTQALVFMAGLALFSSCGLSPTADIFGVQVTTYSDFFLRGGIAHFIAEVSGAQDNSVMWAVLDEDGKEYWEDEMPEGLEFKTLSEGGIVQAGEIFLSIPVDYPAETITVRAKYANARVADDPRNYGDATITLVDLVLSSRPEKIEITNDLKGFFRGRLVLFESEVKWENDKKPEVNHPDIDLEAVVWHIVEGETDKTFIGARNGLLAVDQFQRVGSTITIRATLIHFGLFASFSAEVRPDFSIEIIPPPEKRVPRGSSGKFEARVVTFGSADTNVRWSIRNIDYEEVNGQVTKYGRPAAAYIVDGVLTVSAAEQGDKFDPDSGEGFLWVEATSWEFPDVTERYEIPIGGWHRVEGDFRFVHAGNHHSLAIDWEGGLWVWGHGASGILANNTTMPSNGEPSPTPISVVKDGENVKFAYVTSGGTFNSVNPASSIYYALAIAEDGTLWAWGNDNNGKTGLGKASGTSEPTQVKSLDGVDNQWVHVSAGATHSVGIRRDGTLWGWGSSNSNGLEVSNTGLRDQLTPARISNDTDWMLAEAGIDHSLAVKKDGTLYVWGSAEKGQLGLGSNDYERTPKKSTALELAGVRVAMVLAGNKFSTVVDETGKIWIWGALGTYFSSRTPQVLSSGTAKLPLRSVSLNADGSHVLILDNEGSLYGMGANDVYQLTSNVPNEVRSLTQLDTNQYLAISAGHSHSIVLKDDQSNYRHYGVGGDVYGELGRSFDSSRSPKEPTLEPVKKQ